MAVILTDVPVSSRERVKPWLWFNLLSIDAPVVAVVWQLWFARCFEIALSPLSVAALALTVWMIYASDRLLDVRGSDDRVPATERHLFHRDHSRALSAAVAICFVTLLFATVHLNPALLRNGLLLIGLVGLYFCAVHLLPPAVMKLCPKEVAVGTVFAAGTALAPWSRMHRAEPFLVPVALFAVLCSLNCAGIEAWEWERLGGVVSNGPPHGLTLWLSRHLRLLAGFVALLGSVFFLLSRSHTIFAPIVVSAIAFLWLDIERERLTVSLLRVLADLPLLSPLLLLRIH